MKWKIVFVIVGGLLLLADAGKEKKLKEVKKRPGAVSDPLRLRSLDDWINLGKIVLMQSCEAAGLQATGPITALARRLHRFYADQHRISVDSETVASITFEPISSLTGKKFIYCL